MQAASYLSAVFAPGSHRAACRLHAIRQLCLLRDPHTELQASCELSVGCVCAWIHTDPHAGCKLSVSCVCAWNYSYQRRMQAASCLSAVFVLGFTQSCMQAASCLSAVFAPGFTQSCMQAASSLPAVFVRKFTQIGAACRPQANYQLCLLLDSHRGTCRLSARCQLCICTKSAQLVACMQRLLLARQRLETC